MFLLFFAVWTLNVRSAYLYTSICVINIVVVLLIVSGRDNPAYKLAWTVVILGLPVFGVLIYFIAGTHYLSHNVRKRLETSQNFDRQHLRQQDAVLKRLEADSPALARQAKYILSASARPVYGGTEAVLLTPGEKMFDALLDAVRRAEHYVYLEFFIIAEGTMWDTLFSLLREKAASGVEIRIIYDDIGTLDHISRNFKRKVREAGIRICTFNPFLPFPGKFMNYRDHRKIVVVDGAVGITGGINIGDEYINRTRPHGHWKDTSILLRGPAVDSLTVMFLEMWHLITGEGLDTDRRPSAETAEASPLGFVQPYDDIPVDFENVTESAYLQLINSANRSVHITTPYLILDNEMATALCLAAKSGVDVRVITPFIGDKWYVHMVTRANYKRLLESGVKIYEYLPGFIHSKTCVCDGETGIVGSVNFDYRSFYQQFECAVWLCRSPVLAALADDFAETQAVSQQIELENWEQRGLLRKFFELLLQLFAPMM